MKARIEVGFTRSDLSHYRHFRREYLEGADATFKDGVGNVVEVSIRTHGYRITLNGQDLNVSLNQEPPTS
ncbi:hypothetical protein LCGC14_0498590 [marine sediment metagenome]|uniref:Uncharacterized protein n=1 Tax=marine sediment metagenome TaxID=412755 RepID=A0A0F9S4H4_9ZZZZ